MREKEIGGMRLLELPNGNIQVYGKRRDKTVHLTAHAHCAWRLAFELTTEALANIISFAQTKK
jgi:hypothetical protein